MVKMRSCVRLRLMSDLLLWFWSRRYDFVASDLIPFDQLVQSTFTVHFRGQELGNSTFQPLVVTISWMRQPLVGLYSAGFYLNFGAWTFWKNICWYAVSKSSMTRWLSMIRSPSNRNHCNLGCGSSEIPKLKEIVAVFQPHTLQEPLPCWMNLPALNQAGMQLPSAPWICFSADHGDAKAEDPANELQKHPRLLLKCSPLLDHDNAVYVFMGAGDIQPKSIHSSVSV